MINKSASFSKKKKRANKKKKDPRGRLPEMLPLIYEVPKNGIDSLYYNRILSDKSIGASIGLVSIKNAEDLIARMRSLKSGKQKVIERETKDLLERIMDSSGLFLFPCPMYSSPIALVLDPTSPVLNSSYHLLRLLCITERKVYYGCALTQEKKAKIAETRNKFIDRIAYFARTEGGFHRVFQLPQNAVHTDAAFMKENFFNSLNVINILEMTILDYLEVPETEQERWVTYGQSSLPASNALLQECFAQLRRDMGHTDIKASAIDTSASWISVTDLRELMQRSRLALLKQVSFKCFGCDAKEKKPMDFPRCSRCGWARYCSAECQKKHWATHKLDCCKEKTLEEMDKGRLLIGASTPEEK